MSAARQSQTESGSESIRDLISIGIRVMEERLRRRRLRSEAERQAVYAYLAEELNLAYEDAESAVLVLFQEKFLTLDDIHYSPRQLRLIGEMILKRFDLPDRTINHPKSI